MGRRGRRTKEMVSTAKQRIETLFRYAREHAHKGNIDYANRYVDLAKKVGMRYNVRIPKEYNLESCGTCGSYLHAKGMSRVRLTGGKLTITCLTCMNTKRYPYLREQKTMRREGNDA